MAVPAALVTVFFVGGSYYFSGEINNERLQVSPGVPATTQTGTLTELTPPSDGTRGP